VWSTRPTPTGVETLEALKVGADESLKLMVAADVSQWAIAPDGSQWYWLAGYNYDVTGAPAGTLQAASFPDGAGVTTVAPNVGEFSLVGGAGLWFRANVTAQVGSLDWMADRGAPAAVMTVDTNVLVVFDETQDGAGFVYAKNFTTLSPVTDSAGGASQPFNLVDLYLGSGTGATPCTLADAPTAFQGALLPSGSGVVWERFNQGTGDTEGLETRAKSCTSTQFAARLRKVSPVMDQGLVYLDDSDPAADESTLRYAPIGEGTPGMGTQLQTRAASVFAVLLPALPAVVYTVGAHTPSDGLYINAALPFTAASAPPAPSPLARSAPARRRRVSRDGRFSGAWAPVRRSCRSSTPSARAARRRAVSPNGSSPSRGRTASRRPRSIRPATIRRPARSCSRWRPSSRR
jgi:hypothetical protein